MSGPRHDAISEHNPPSCETGSVDVYSFAPANKEVTLKLMSTAVDPKVQGMQRRESPHNSIDEEGIPLHTPSTSHGGRPPSGPSPWLTPPWPPPKENSDLFSNHDLVVCRLRSSSTFSINILIGDQLLRAVVDTSAEVTIMSDKIYQTLRPVPPRCQNCSFACCR